MKKVPLGHFGVTFKRRPATAFIYNEINKSNIMSQNVAKCPIRVTLPPLPRPEMAYTVKR